MTALASLLPDVRRMPVALGIARRAIRKSGEDDGLKDYLVTTAVEMNGVVYFRPFAAARSWLRNNPKWLEKAEGVEWRSLDDALKGLASSQAQLDGAFGLVIPAYLDDGGGGVMPGPTFTSWG